jgi:uncharacterized protein (DUF2062 family)
MARKFFKRFMPDPEMIRRHRSLQLLNRWLHDANLWHLNRYSVSIAFFIGMFAAFVPLPSQMLIAGGLAIWWRANLPISVALVWTSNPITMPFFFGASYLVGAKLLGHSLPTQFEPTLSWFQANAATLWQPFVLGSIVSGLLAGVACALIVRVFWRLQVGLRWHARLQRHKRGDI